MAIVARHLTISGKVQGVFYRSWTVSTAQGLGLAGWVRNRTNGDVEAVVQGEEAAVERLIALAWDGPPAARVTEVRAEAAEPVAHQGFEQRATG